MIALTASIIHAITPVKWPVPHPRTTYSRNPPADGYRAPSFANEYPWRAATPPARRNEIQTAAPATSPAAPSSAKIPAPTMEPTPMKAAWRVDKVGLGSLAPAARVASPPVTVTPSQGHVPKNDRRRTLVGVLR